MKRLDSAARMSKGLLGLVLLLAILSCSWCSFGSASSAASISGSFEATFSINPEPLETQLDAETELSLARAPWEAGLKFEIEEDRWDLLTLGASWHAGPWAIESTLRLEPDDSHFKDWKTEAVFGLDPWTVEWEHKLTRTRNWLHIDVEWMQPDCELGGRIRFRSSPCQPLAFYDAEVSIELDSWPTWNRWAGCQAETALEIAFDDEGFDQLTIEIEGLALEKLPWLVMDLEIERATDDVKIEISPEAQLGEAACLELEAVAEVSGLAIGTLTVGEARLEAEIRTIDIQADVIWDPDEWIDDTYSARFEAEKTITDGCGHDLDTTLTLLWEGPPGTSFALTRMEMEIVAEIEDGLEVGLIFEIPLDASSPSGISLSFEYDW